MLFVARRALDEFVGNLTHHLWLTCLDDVEYADIRVLVRWILFVEFVRQGDLFRIDVRYGKSSQVSQSAKLGTAA